MKRHTWNVNDPPPPELLSTFDIINCQLLWTFVPDKNVDAVLKNILSLLKPGGTIQWLESSAIDEQIFSADPNYTPVYLPRAYEQAFVLYDVLKPTWPRDLDKVFARNNVTVLKTERSSVEPKNYKSWAMQQNTTWEEVKAFFLASIDSEERRVKVEEFAKIVDGCHWEVQSKDCVHIIPFIRVVGKKEA